MSFQAFRPAHQRINIAGIRHTQTETGSDTKASDTLLNHTYPYELREYTRMTLSLQRRNE